MAILPYSQEFGDHFYSRADGRLECDHVFLHGNNVEERWTATERFSIGELGFGTGLKSFGNVASMERTTNGWANAFVHLFRIVSDASERN